MNIQIMIGLVLIGMALGGYIAFKVINYIGTKSQVRVARRDNELEFNVLGSVINTTPDRLGQPMTIYGNDLNEYFVHTTIDFENKFKEV